MGPIKSRIFRAADGNTNRVVYALDGMRARNDLSGWEIDTEVARELTKWNINVVMPVGGMSSFYADWNAPSTILGIGGGSSGSASGSSSGSGALQKPALGVARPARVQPESQRRVRSVDGRFGRADAGRLPPRPVQLRRFLLRLPERLGAGYA
ncbi:putative esterase [Mycobacteroides abscessus subsp. abscessus]|nr:putative esterase [Mycobacteroides abscessus subsp. abscessus]